MEEWREIPVNDNYEASNLGKIRNKKTKRILKACNSGGYSHVGLSHNGLTKSISVHQLVGKAFLENPENKQQINHIDKNGLNNNISNLEWATAAENNIHKCLTLKQNTNQNLKVWRCDKETGDKIELHNSIQEASKWCFENGYSPGEHNARGNISYVLNGRYKSSCGFKWILNEQPDLENEIWKNINVNGQTFNNYFVSTLGRFKNSKGIIMENYKPHHSGYIYVRVNKIKHSLHQLMGSTFLENPYLKPVVNHIDGNKTNNCLDNLEWATFGENIEHSHRTGLIKVFTRKIGQYSLEGELIKEYISIVEAIKETNINSIKKVLYNKQKTSGGFIWKYLD